MDYKLSNANHSLLTKIYESHFTTLLVYVDDIVLAGNNPSEIQYVKTFLDNKFKIKDLGCLCYFLGLESVRSPQGLRVKQKKYTLELLAHSGFLAAKSCSTPFGLSLKLHVTDSPYQRALLFSNFPLRLPIVLFWAIVSSWELSLFHGNSRSSVQFLTPTPR